MTTNRRPALSRKTRDNWLTDAALFGCALVAAVSGVYFCYLPTGGYQGGRNAMYGVTILFDRDTWSDVHTWGGVLMIIAAVVHFAIHWTWVKTMAKRIANRLRGRGARMSRGAWNNLLIDGVIAVSFLITAVSGLVFLLAPVGHGAGADFIISRTAWDLIHTWAGVIMIIAAVVHFAIHWRWVTKVTGKFFASLWPQSGTDVTQVSG
jgi:preprotein translocase subunit SecY